MFRKLLCYSPLVCLLLSPFATAEDWTRFRGPGGQGVAAATESVPLRWSPTANVAWKTELPGPGVSSPIVVGSKVFVTCYSGYGLDQANPGDMNALVRHVVCADLATGKVLWQKDIPAKLPEDPYQGVGVTAHGYASHTPVSDGKHLFAFLGKSGVHAFDFDGNQLWQIDVGNESDPTKWGSSSSPVLHGDTVIVTAAAESQSIIGLDKATGKELWRQEAEGLDGMWGTPTLVQITGDRTDLVMCVAKEIWGLNPNTGQLRWFASATDAEHAYSSVVTAGTNVFAVTGRGGGTVAVQAGGQGDITDASTLWTGPDTGSFGSPVAHNGKLYSIARGVITILDATSGDKLDQVRLQGAEKTGGRFGSLDYASPIIVGDKMLYLNGSGQMFVFDLAGEFKQIAINRMTTDKESFGGSPAVSNGHLVARSEKHLYAIRDLGGQVAAYVPPPAEAEAPDAPSSRGPGGPGAGGGQWDPMSLFKQRDKNGDGQVTAAELEGNPMADFLMGLDKDKNGSISQDEFRTGMSTMFGGGSRGGGGPSGNSRAGGSRGEGSRGEAARGDGGGSRGGGSSGGGSRGGGSWGRSGPDTRPDRPQRPTMADTNS